MHPVHHVYIQHFRRMREFRNVDVTEWLQQPNSDDILRDLSLIRMLPLLFVTLV